MSRHRAGHKSERSGGLSQSWPEPDAWLTGVIEGWPLGTEKASAIFCWTVTKQLGKAIRF